MDRLILISVFLTSLFSNAYCQNLDTLYPGRELIRNILYKNDSSILVITSEGHLNRLNYSGDLTRLASLTDPLGWSLTPISIVKPHSADADSFNYVTARSFQCDIAIGAFLFKVDYKGSVELISEVYEINLGAGLSYPSPVIGSSVFPNINGLPEWLLMTYENELLAYYDQDSITIIDTIDWILHVTIDNVGGIVVLTEDSLLYYKPDSSGFTLVNRVSVLTPMIGDYNLLTTADTQFVFINKGDAIIYNHKLTDTTSLLPDLNEHFKKAFLHDTILYLLAVNDEGENLVYGYSENFTRIFKKKIEFKDTYLSDMILVSEDNFLITGIESFENNHWAMFVKNFTDSLPYFQTGYDIGITGIKYDSYTVSEGNSCLIQIYEKWTLQNVSIEVVNNGSQIVNEIFVSPEFFVCSPFCDPIYIWNAWLTDLDLQSGEKKYVNLGQVVHYNRNAINPETICLFVSNPDQHFDINHDNNQACILRTVGLEDAGKEWNSPILFPNPVTDVIHLAQGKEVRRLNIFALDGKPEMTFTDFSDDIQEFNVLPLLPGIHFYQIEMEDGLIEYGKFIKL